MSDQQAPDSNHRAPTTFGETLLANFRPQPAIPALLVLAVTILVPALLAGPVNAAGDNESLFLLLIPVGIVASCGLAIAAGFCSLFPPLAWIAVAIWAFRFTQSGPLPGYNRMVLLAGIAASILMIVVQIWRVQTGRFLPTIRIEHED